MRLAEEHPKKLTTEFHKAKRGDRIFVDVLRNRYAQHAVPPYAVQAASQARRWRRRSTGRSSTTAR